MCWYLNIQSVYPKAYQKEDSVGTAKLAFFFPAAGCIFALPDEKIEEIISPNFHSKFIFSAVASNVVDHLNPFLSFPATSKITFYGHGL